MQSPCHFPTPLALHPAWPHSIRDMPEHEGPGELWGWPGRAGISPCRTFPWKTTCFSQGRLAGLQKKKRYPSSLCQEPHSPPETRQAALVLPLFHQSAGETKAGKVPAARDGACCQGHGGDGHPPAPKASCGLSPAASATRHARQMPAVTPCQQGCMCWGIPSPVPPRLGEGQRKSKPHHPGAEPKWGRGTFPERMHRYELLFQPGL